METPETKDDSPRVCDVMSVMVYVTMFILLLLFAVFMSFFTVISGTAYVASIPACALVQGVEGHLVNVMIW